MRDEALEAVQCSSSDCGRCTYCLALADLRRSEESQSPGPWRWEDFTQDDGTWHLRDNNGDSVLRAEVGDVDAKPLIAAAPELLEALKDVLSLGDGEGTMAYLRARELIARIETKEGHE